MNVPSGWGHKISSDKIKIIEVRLEWLISGHCNSSAVLYSLLLELLSEQYIGQYSNTTLGKHCRSVSKTRKRSADWRKNSQNCSQTYSRTDNSGRLWDRYFDNLVTNINIFYHIYIYVLTELLPTFSKIPLFFILFWFWAYICRYLRICLTVEPHNPQYLLGKTNKIGNKITKFRYHK